MDPYRIRTITRIIGLGMLVMFGALFAVAQRQLAAVRLKAEKKGVLHSTDGPGHTSDPGTGTEMSSLAASRELMGPSASIRATMDFDRDGQLESIVIVPLPGAPPRDTWAGRVGVIGRSPTGRFALLFDSARATDLPPHPDSPARFRVFSLDRGHLDVEPVGPGGEPRGPAHRIEMDRASGNMHAVQLPDRTPPPAAATSAALPVEATLAQPTPADATPAQPTAATAPLAPSPSAAATPAESSAGGGSAPPTQR